jgi:hypothetical protein
MISGRQAWAAMAVGIVIYEVRADEGQLLSEIVDEWLESHPVLTRAAVGAVALHLLNLLPWYADPLGKRLWKRIFS